MRTSTIENKERGHVSSKKQWISNKTNRPIKKLEWSIVDSTGTLIGEKNCNRRGRYKGWWYAPDQYQGRRGYTTYSRYKYDRRTGNRINRIGTTVDSTGKIVAMNTTNSRGVCKRWSYDIYVENPKGYRIYNKINNCHRAHNDLTPSGQIIRKRWAPDGDLVDVIDFKDDGTKIVGYKYKLDGKWERIDYYDNAIWNRVYE